MSAGRLLIDGRPLDEPYLEEPPVGDFPPRTVPAGAFWMMGDNRNRSSDSRLFGAVGRTRIDGVAVRIDAPPQRRRPLPLITQGGPVLPARDTALVEDHGVGPPAGDDRRPLRRDRLLRLLRRRWLELRRGAGTTIPQAPAESSHEHPAAWTSAIEPERIAGISVRSGRRLSRLTVTMTVKRVGHARVAAVPRARRPTAALDGEYHRGPRPSRPSGR